MKRFKLGVILGSFAAKTETALENAASIGAEGIQVSFRDVFGARGYDEQKKRKFLSKLMEQGLKLSAFGTGIGLEGFSDTDGNKARIEKLKETFYLARELGTDIVVAHIGVIPEDNTADIYKIMLEACFESAGNAKEADVYFAIETGPDRAETLRGFLDELDTERIAVNFDPANLVMIHGQDPAKAVHILNDHIIHTHAKDGVRLKEVPARILYGRIEEEVRTQVSFKEMQLGEGDVSFSEYLEALDAVGYDGYLTIEREIGDDRKEDIRTGAQYLNSIINKIFD